MYDLVVYFNYTDTVKKALEDDGFKLSTTEAKQALRQLRRY